jgi:hypothetical protein
LGPAPDDTIELVYNDSFGELPELRLGMDVEACGDYITSYAPSGPYPASPDGALVHWVHHNPHGSHPDGYVVIDGKVFGWTRAAS